MLEAAAAVLYAGEYLPDGSYVERFTGPGLRRLLGGDPPAGVDVGEDWTSRVHPDDVPVYTGGMARQQSGEPWAMEYRIHGVDGRWRWMRDHGRPRPPVQGHVWVDGVIQDVTDQRDRDVVARAATRELDVVRSRLDAVLASLDEYLYAWRYGPDGERIEFESMTMAAFLRRDASSASPADEWLEAVHPDDRQAVLEGVFGPQEQGEGGSCEYRVVDRDGAVRWVHDRWTCQPVDGGWVSQGIVGDVTERRRAEAELAQALAEQQAAYAALEAARAVAERASREDALTGLANRRQFSDALGARYERALTVPFGVVLLDVDRFKRVNDTYGHHVGDDVLVGVSRIVAARVPAEATLARWGGEEFIVSVPAGDPEVLRAVAEEIRSAVAEAPLPTRDGDVHVTVSCGAAVWRHGVGQDALVDAADRALYRAKETGRNRTVVAGEEPLLRTASEPELVRFAMSLARAASIREGVPERHCDAVSDLAGRLADELGLPRDLALRCRLAGWLHDVGKIVIPDRILAKPGKLDEDEWAVMRTHAAVGSELVARTPGLEDVAPAVRHHHERVDGRGYPDGLAGAAIPIEARIVAVADTWSAMTEDRVYRQAHDAATALTELERAAGSQLDPQVVAALQRVLRAERAARRAEAERATG